MKNKAKLLVLLALLGSALWGQTNNIVAYEYWFNNNYDDRTFVEVSHEPTLVLDALLDAPTAQNNFFYYLHVRFLDGQGHWSATQTQKVWNTNPFVNVYEYWFDDQEPIQEEVTPSQTYTLNTQINAPENSTSFFHNLKIRFKDKLGSWSATQSAKVWRTSPNLASFEYWLNDNYPEKITVDIDPGNSFTLSEGLELPSWQPGFFNDFSIRFIDQTGNFSAIHTSKIWNPGHTLSAYEFWLDNKVGQINAGLMEGETTETWTHEFGLNHHNRFDSLHVRFMDAKGVFSGTLSMASPPPVANFYFIKDRYWARFTNTSLLGSEFKWLFGDSQESTQVNPSHHFNDPGEWEVCLVATNNSGSDTLCHYVSIRGIQSVMPNKVGNGGAATLTITGGGLTPNAIVTIEKDGLPTLTADTVYVASPGRLKARFGLLGQQIGLYDVKVALPDTVMTREGALEIEHAVPVEFYADIGGRNVVLVDRWQTYTVNYGNLGNNDLPIAPLWIAVSDVPGLEVQFVSRTIDLPLDPDPTWLELMDSVQPWFPIDSLGAEPFQARVYPLFLPLLAANESGSFTVRVKSPSDFRITTWVNPDWYVDAKISDYQSCVMWAQATALANGLVSIIGSQIPGAGCVGAISLGLMSYDYDNASLGSATYSMVRAAIDCVWDMGSQLPFFIAWNLTKEILSLAANIYDNYQAIESCKRKFKQDKRKNKGIRAVTSFDPNEIVGPDGFAEARYNHDYIKHPYKIYFENLSTATAPAQEVFVFDTLDLTKFDLSTFALGNIAWADNTVYVPEGLKEYSTDIDLRPEKDIILRINAWLDEEAGVANWAFMSFDPETMDLTEDPFGGFLPPNANSPEGEGYVSFSINLLPDQPHNAQIHNKATIVFDLNAPIVTNTWINTIDHLAPVSSVDPLPAQTFGSSFEVSWYGQDAHSGLDHFSIYYSKDGAAPQLWIYETRKLEDTFEGEIGSTYRFYSIATDMLGNEETFNGVYQATTTVNEFVSVTDNPYVPFFNVYPNPANDYVYASFQHLEPGTVEITLLDMLGRRIQQHSLVVGGTDVVRFPINVSSLSNGGYIVSLRSNKAAINRMIVIQK